MVSYLAETDAPIRAVFTQFLDQQGNDVKVDVVTGTGASTSWIKLSARSRSATRRVVQGDCGFNQRSIVDVAISLRAAAAHNTVDFAEPRVIFKFCGDGIYHCVSKELLDAGVEVVGNVHQCTDDRCCLDAHECEPTVSEVETTCREGISTTCAERFDTSHCGPEEVLQVQGFRCIPNIVPSYKPCVHNPELACLHKYTPCITRPD